jgi:CBS domain-containing protein
MRHWAVACAAGVVVASAVAAAAAGLLVMTIGEPCSRAESAMVLGVMVGAGALGGVALGSLQWRVLGRRLPSVGARSWIGATAAMAAFVWFVGMLPSTFLAPETWASGPILEPPYLPTLALVQLFGLGFGGLLGLAQWIVLRRHAQGAWKWILANALGWSAGLPFLYLVAAVPLVETSLGLNFVASAAVAAAGGLCMGAITGAFLSRITPMGVEGGVMLCREIMKTDIARCAEALSVQACAEIMREDNIGFLPVVDADRQVIGVITDRDLAIRVLADDLPGDTPVGQVMTRDVRICRPDDELQAAEWKMSSTRKSRLVVVDDEGHCVGVISLSDVAQADTRSRAGGVLRAVTRREAPAHVVLS